MSTPAIVPLDSKKGGQLLQSAHHFWPMLGLLGNLINSSTAHSGIACAATLLNALRITAPYTPQFFPGCRFTEENIFNEKVSAAFPYSKAYNQAIQLEQLSDLLKQYDQLQVVATHSDQMDFSDLERVIEEELMANRYIVVNYSPSIMGCRGDDDHFAIVAAHNPLEHHVLLVNPCTCLYQPFWVDVKLLWAAMRREDKQRSDYLGILTVYLLTE